MLGRSGLQRQRRAHPAGRRELAGLVAIFLRLEEDGRNLAPYLGVGGGVFETIAVTHIGAGGPGRREGDLRAGIAGLAGLDILAGPGSVLFEARVQYAPTLAPPLKGTTIGLFSAVAGYRFRL